MCLAHLKAISLLSKSTQRTIFQLGTISRYPLESGYKVLAPTLAHIPQKAWLCFWSCGEAEGGVSLKFAHVHLDRAMVVVHALPADYWCVGRRRGYCQPKYRCIELLLQPTYDRHPRNEGNTPWAAIRLILLPFSEGSYVLSNRIIFLRAIALRVTG